MALKKSLSGNEFIQFLQDSSARAFRVIQETTSFLWGVPTEKIREDYTAKFGNMVRVDPSEEAFSIFLPSIGRSDVGKAIVIVNISSSTNTITITTRNDATIGGSASTTITTAYGYVILVAVDTNLWVEA